MITNDLAKPQIVVFLDKAVIKCFEKGNLIDNWVEMKNCGLKIVEILARWTY